LPRDAFDNRRRAGELSLAVTDRFEDWREEKTNRLVDRLGGEFAGVPNRL
jgi:hypothetical protein